MSGKQELQVTGERALIEREVRLGGPKHPLQKLFGALVGAPLGLGVVMAPHGLLLGVGGGAFAVYLGALTVSSLSAMKRFAVDNSVAIGALGRGELAKAHEVFLRWAPHWNDVISATARHNLGWTLMLEGRVEEAATILIDAAEHYQAALNRTALLPTTRVDIALCLGLLGKLDVAEDWRVKADEPVKAAPRPTLPGMKALASAVIACRTGKAADAMVTLEHAWSEHEATMTGETLRVMRVVRAFASASVDGPRNQGIVERVLGDMRPRYDGEFAFLGATWPEMAAFLAAHQLAPV